MRAMLRPDPVAIGIAVTLTIVLIVISALLYL